MLPSEFPGLFSAAGNEARFPSTERSSQMAPFQRLALAEYLVDRGETDAGVKQYEQWLETSGDEVGIGRTGKEVDRLMAAIFPSGMKRVTSADFRTAPVRGAEVTDSGEIGQRQRRAARRRHRGG
jgi:hypothetical protein